METSISGPLIVASKSDPASFNIAETLKEKFQFTKQKNSPEDPSVYSKGNTSLTIIGKIGIYTDPDDIPQGATTLVFASKHESSSGKPALTVHATGNPTTEALYGGEPQQLAFVDPPRIKEALRTLRGEATRRELQIDVSMEATHHGPTRFGVPVMFVEIGTGPREWSDPTLGEIAAKAVVAAASLERSSSANAVGFGGTHYPEKHTRICADSTLAIGHVLSRYSFDAGVSSTTIKQAFDKTANPCETAVVDWKGLNGKQRKDLLSLLRDWSIQVERR